LEKSARLTRVGGLIGIKNGLAAPILRKRPADLKEASSGIKNLSRSLNHGIIRPDNSTPRKLQAQYSAGSKRTKRFIVGKATYDKRTSVRNIAREEWTSEEPSGYLIESLKNRRGPSLRTKKPLES